MFDQSTGRNEFFKHAIYYVCTVRILTEVDTAPLTFSGQYMPARTNVRILG